MMRVFTAFCPEALEHVSINPTSFVFSKDFIDNILNSGKHTLTHKELY